MRTVGTWYTYVTIEWPDRVDVKRWRGRSRAVLTAARAHYAGAVHVQVGRQFWIADR